MNAEKMNPYLFAGIEIKNQMAYRRTLQHDILHYIHNIVFDYLKAERDDTSQKREFLIPRQIAMYVMHWNTPMKHNDIGLFYHRDRTTVLTTISHIQDMVDVYPDFKEKILAIEKLF